MPYSDAEPAAIPGAPTGLPWRSTILLILASTLVYILSGYAVQRARAISEGWLDPDQIGEIGRNLCRLGEFSERPGVPTVLRGPAFPVAIAVPCRLTGIDAARFIPFVNGLCHMLLLLVLALHPLGRHGRASQLALLAIGLDPLLLNYAGRALIEPMLFLAVALVIAGVDRLARKPDLRSTVLLGLAWAFSLLVKPILIYLAGALVVTLLFVNRRAALRSVASFVLAVLCISPWTVRNLAVTGRLIPVATGAWEIVLKGDTYSRFLFHSDGIVALEDMAKADLASLNERLGIAGLPLHEREPHYQAEEFRRIAERPQFFAYKMLVQSVVFWFLGGDPAKTITFALFQLPILGLAVLALAVWKPFPSRHLLGVLIVSAYLLLVHSASLSFARYSMPLRPWLALVAITSLLLRFWGGRLGGHSDGGIGRPVPRHQNSV